MRDVASAFDAEHEVCRGLLVPALVVGWALQGVKRTVDLDRGQHTRGELELPPLGQILGIENAAPRWVAPSGDADANRAQLESPVTNHESHATARQAKLE